MMRTYAKPDSTKKRLPDLKSMGSEHLHKIVNLDDAGWREGSAHSSIRTLIGRLGSPSMVVTTILLIASLFFASSDALYAQKKKKEKIPKHDAALIDTIRAINLRGDWQFPIRRLWDDALQSAKKSRRPVIAFNVDYVDPNSILVRDKLLQDPEVMIYLTKNFELALNDFSVDPPPNVGFDSLRNLGVRLDGLEKGYNIVSRPTAILLDPDGTEIERISNLEHYSPAQFVALVKDYLAGRGTVRSIAAEFWNEPTNLDKHKRYLDRLMDRFDYDSILYHYKLLATVPGYGQTPEVMKEAAAEYAYLRFKQEGNITVLKSWLATLDQKADGEVMLAGLKDILEYYQVRKKLDSVAIYYHRIFELFGEREPDMLNNFAWDIANLSVGYDSAMIYINEAIVKDGKNPNYYDTRALIENNRKDHDAAIADARQALKYSPKDDKDYFKERLEFYEKAKNRSASEGNKE
ncbi:MAG: hypothetical protein ABI778_02935 [Ignavibacteriota bacterium]